MLNSLRELVLKEYYDKIKSFSELVFRVEHDVREFLTWVTNRKEDVYDLLESIPSTVKGDEITYSVNNLLFSIRKVFDGDYSLLLEFEPPVHPILQLAAGFIYLEKKYYPVLYVRTEPTVSNILVFVKFNDIRKASITAVGIPLTLVGELAQLRASIFPVKYPLNDESSLEEINSFYLTEVGYTLFRPVNTSVSVELKLDITGAPENTELTSSLRNSLRKVVEN